MSHARQFHVTGTRECGEKGKVLTALEDSFFLLITATSYHFRHSGINLYNTADTNLCNLKLYNMYYLKKN